MSNCEIATVAFSFGHRITSSFSSLGIWVFGYLGIWVLPSFGQPQLTNVQDPAALVVGASGQVFVYERGNGRIVRPKEMHAVAVVDDLLTAGPNRFTSVAGLVAREKRTISIVGLADGVIRLVTYDVSDGKPAVTVPGLSGDFPPGSAAGAIRELFAVTATDFAIYVAVGGDGGRYALLRIPAQRSSLGKPNILFQPSTASAHPTSMTVNTNGHLLMAMSASEKTATLRFHHATTGRTLLVLSTDLKEIRWLSYSGHGLLYAAAPKDQREGIYRLDVAFDDKRQILRSVEMARLPDIVAIECRPSGNCWALVGGQQDGRLLRIDLE
jgi:hypothetical protein